ncbi:hypothetical protein AUK11_01990 [bacterium CG2_30_37_16]|nr:MAG: hypothetical protein AUK11_01990 [bacterium CG2_30_37_16]PIX99496.1 MAG: hypothetical protein COZ22_02380 [bacterium (Candidatus Howlettbacteria) CG_4_10_14_3_um_filter_37_10]PJB06937.1 MAG: hypothetical protein CO123_01105 [bacterium (Candidatus Howlettbacteria) CG_4_9_14_3_um_filter_37_10]
MSNLLITLFIVSDLLLPSIWAKNIQEKYVSLEPNTKTQKVILTKGKQIELSNLPVKNSEQIFYTNLSDTLFAIDLNTNFVLLDKNSYSKVPMASLTKLMTAYLTFENLQLDDIATVSQFNLSSEESYMGLFPGEKISIRDLLYGLLVESAGDAAIILGREISDTDLKFVSRMNETAKKIGLTSTNFENPSGVDSPSHYSSARDLATLARILLNDNEFKNIVKTKEFDAKSTSGYIHHLANTNKLLDNGMIFGVKTGKTNLAGECLITLARIKNHDVLIIVMGSKNRFTETTNIISWIGSSYVW